jgi:phage/plasmid-associated DNA primase
MFIDPFGEDVADYYILNIARGLAGDAMKRCLFGIGDGNTGKSAMTSAIKSVAGGYFGTFNANNLVVKKHANPDDAQALRWVMLLANKRIIASNELEPDVEINGSVLKKLSSGGKDDIVARKHGGYETEYKISFLPIIFANDLDKISPMDDAIVNRVRAIPYEKKYVENPKNKNYELKIDPNFDEEIQTPKFRSAFMLLLMKAYKNFMKNKRVENEPEQIRRAFVSTFGKVEEYVDTFKNNFEFTDNENDFVESSIMIEWIKQNKLNISMTKLGRDIHKYCDQNKLKNVQSKLKKIGGKPKQVWFGIRILGEEEEEEEQEEEEEEQDELDC